MSGKVCTRCGAHLRNRRGGVGEPVRELFDEDLFRKSRILKLVECADCRCVADRYPEREGVLILMDLVLQFPEAYRHVLFNGDYRKLILKMALLTVICDGYVRWASLASAGEFFEQEYQFYVTCVTVAMGLLAFVAIALLPCKPAQMRTSLLGLLMAYSARFCNMAAFLWASNDAAGSELMWAFIYFLFFVATVRILQVCQGRNVVSSVVIAVLAHLAFNLMLNFDYLVQPMSCE